MISICLCQHLVILCHNKETCTQKGKEFFLEPRYLIESYSKSNYHGYSTHLSFSPINKNMAQEQPWIWQSFHNISPLGTTGTTPFPDRLTHSYYSDLDLTSKFLFNTQPPNLAEGIIALTGLAFFVHFLTIIYQTSKCSPFEKGDTKQIRRWIRINYCLGKQDNARKCFYIKVFMFQVTC